MSAKFIAILGFLMLWVGFAEADGVPTANKIGGALLLVSANLLALSRYLDK